MRRIAMLLLSAVAFAGLSTGAEAATAKKKAVLKAKPITKAPPAATSSSGGTGFYVGVNGGYDWGRATFNQITFRIVCAAPMQRATFAKLTASPAPPPRLPNMRASAAARLSARPENSRSTRALISMRGLVFCPVPSPRLTSRRGNGQWRDTMNCPGTVPLSRATP